MDILKKKNTLIELFILIGFVQEIKGYWNWGLCPLINPTPVMNFSVDGYIGSWYEIYRDKNLWYE